MQLVKYLKSGLLATGLEKVLVQGIGFAQGVILARLLQPGDFGLAAMLGIFLGVGTALAESGLGMAYVVYGRNSRRVFWWNVGIGVAIYAVLAALSPVIANFYGEPILKPLLWVMGLGVVLNSACVLGNARLQRERQFGQLSALNVATTLVAFLAAVVFALSGYGVWAIAWMGIAGAVLRLIALASVKMMTFASDDEGDFGRMLGYGLKLTLSGLIHTAYLNAYNLIVGKMFSPLAVGLFSRGQRWANLPTEVVNDSVGRVSLPDMAQGKKSARAYLLLNALLIWPLLAVLWLFAEQVVGFVLGSAWIGCVLFMRILVIGVAFTPVTNISLQYIRSKGRSDLILLTDAIKKPIQIGILVAGALMLVDGGMDKGVALLCWVKVASDAIEAATDFVVAWRLRRNSERDFYDVVKLAERLEGCRLRRLHESKALDGFLEGKTIAVVGNGPSELGKGLGQEIDSHDVVIRFNNYKIKGFEKDYGRRTNVWMKGGAADVRYKLRDKSIKAILYTDDIIEEGLIARFSRYPRVELEKGLVVDYLDRKERGVLIDALGVRPSSGAFLAHRLLRVRDVTVDFYGFAFLEDMATRRMDGFEHYAKDVDSDRARQMATIANHDVGMECRWFEAHVNGRRLK